MRWAQVRSARRQAAKESKVETSDDLLDGLSTLGLARKDEQGIEVFYNLAVTPWFRLTGDVQWIDPFDATKDDVVVTDLRAQTRFSGQEGNVRLSPEAEAYFAKKDCEVVILPTPQAIRAFDETHGKKIGLFHVTC